jgi:putative endonuclease
MANRNLIGREGEEEARRRLTAQGYSIYHTNWRWRHYEIDIVAARDGELVIVEVKTRSARYLLPPENAIDRGKIKRLVAAADVYVRHFGLDMPVRFDVIVLIKRRDGYRAEHIRDAFHPPIQE